MCMCKSQTRFRVVPMAAGPGAGSLFPARPQGGDTKGTQDASKVCCHLQQHFVICSGNHLAWNRSLPGLAGHTEPNFLSGSTTVVSSLIAVLLCICLRDLDFVIMMNKLLVIVATLPFASQISFALLIWILCRLVS